MARSEDSQQSRDEKEVGLMRVLRPAGCVYHRLSVSSGCTPSSTVRRTSSAKLVSVPFSYSQVAYTYQPGEKPLNLEEARAFEVDLMTGAGLSECFYALGALSRQGSEWGSMAQWGSMATG